MWVWFGTKKGKRVDELERRLYNTRDWDEADRIEAELYKLTGDKRYAPYEEDDDDTNDED